MLVSKDALIRKAKELTCFTNSWIAMYNDLRWAMGPDYWGADYDL